MLFIFKVKTSSPILILKLTLFHGNPDCVESTKVAKTAALHLQKSSVAGNKRTLCFYGLVSITKETHVLMPLLLITKGIYYFKPDFC